MKLTVKNTFKVYGSEEPVYHYSKNKKYLINNGSVDKTTDLLSDIHLLNIIKLIENKAGVNLAYAAKVKSDMNYEIYVNEAKRRNLI
jgi:hypothetical protein